MKYLFLVFCIVLVTGCSIKNYEHTATKLITIKSKIFKFSDIGYIRHTQDAIELDLFMAGHIYKRIHINHMICVDEGCMNKKEFNKEYLSKAYPPSLLQNIILGKEIYKGKNRFKTDIGFIQQIKTSDVDIKYIVNFHDVYFKDRINHILVKIKDIK